jgi:hypothetical protein
MIRQGHQPPLTIAWVRENVPYQTSELMELYLEGLRKAGLDDEQRSQERGYGGEAQSKKSRTTSLLNVSLDC